MIAFEFLAVNSILSLRPHEVPVDDTGAYDVSALFKCKRLSCALVSLIGNKSVDRYCLLVLVK